MFAPNRRIISKTAFALAGLFLVGGFLATFTIVGAVLIWLGLALLVAAVSLRTALPAALVVVGATMLFVLLSAYTLFVYPGEGF